MDLDQQAVVDSKKAESAMLQPELDFKGKAESCAEFAELQAKDEQMKRWEECKRVLATKPYDETWLQAMLAIYAQNALERKDVKSSLPELDTIAKKKKTVYDALFSMCRRGDGLWIRLFLMSEELRKYLDTKVYTEPNDEDEVVSFRGSRFNLLHIAALFDQEKIVRMLLPSHKDEYELLDRKTTQGWTPLHLCANNRSDAALILLNALEKANFQKIYAGSEDHRSEDWQQIQKLWMSRIFQDDCLMTPLHYAAWASNVKVVNHMVEGGSWFVNLRAVDSFLLTPLHIAAISKDQGDDAEKELIARTILTHLEKMAKSHSRVEFVRHMEALCVNAADCCGFTPLHWAVECDSTKIVKLLVKHDKIEPLEEDKGHIAPLHIAIRDQKRECERLLLTNNRVRHHNERLAHDRQVSVDSANAILVGASLIAGITFTAYMQPPLGYVTYYEYGNYENSPPTDYRAFSAAAKDASVQVFWILNCFSFLFSVATVLASSFTVARSTVWEPQEHLGDLVRKNKRWVLMNYIFFILAVISVLGAFLAVGFGALPPDLKVRVFDFLLPMIVPFMVCTFIVYRFLRNPREVIKIILGRRSFIAESLTKETAVTRDSRIVDMRRSFRLGSTTLSSWMTKSSSSWSSWLNSCSEEEVDVSRTIDDRLKESENFIESREESKSFSHAVLKLCACTNRKSMKRTMDELALWRAQFHTGWSPRQCRNEALQEGLKAYERVASLALKTADRDKKWAWIACSLTPASSNHITTAKQILE